MKKILPLLLLFALVFVAVGCKKDRSTRTTIRFESFTQETLSDLSVDGESVSALVLPDISREGYTFGGWFFDEAFRIVFSTEILKSRLNGKVVTLYAKWEADMEATGITVRGRIGDKVVLNPAFDWLNAQNDEEFGVVLKDGAGQTVFRTEVAETHFELPQALAPNASYALYIAGLASKNVCKIDLETIAAEDAPDFDSATVSVGEPFKSYMVLQRGKATEVKGSAPKNSLVTVDFYGKRYYVLSDQKGDFALTLPAMQANATPTDVEFRLLSEKKTVLSDVLIGDVYLVAGQSNIQWNLKDSDYEESDVDDAILFDVRYYSMSTNGSAKPIDTVKDGKWFKINKNNKGFTYYSAIAFMVGSMLGKELAEKKVPIGIVSASQGDTNIISWMDSSYYEAELPAKKMHYNAMIYPLRQGNFSGVIWYQGCNNSAKGIDYKVLLGKLFENWRALFRDESLPFYVVQLPVFDGDSGNNFDFSYVRESQYLACEEDKNAYLIATCDGGDPTYIHPKQKRYICERLTKSVLASVYGENYVTQSPTYASHTVENGTVVLSVKNGEGLASKGEIVGFELAGEDGKYYDAAARIEEGKIKISSEKIAAPVYVRYGFSKSPFLNIYNKDGFLMSPFRTDRYNRNIDLLDYSDGAVYEANPGGSKMEYRVVQTSDGAGFEIKKANDGYTFGSLQLDKWGAVGYNETKMKIRVIGTNSGAKVMFRLREGSYEIWSFSFYDTFTGEKEFVFSTSELVCDERYKIDGVFDYQAIMNVDVTIEAPAAATITFLDVKFIEDQAR